MISDLIVDWEAARAEFKAVVSTGTNDDYEEALESLINVEAKVAEATGLTPEAVSEISPAKSGVQA